MSMRRAGLGARSSRSLIWTASPFAREREDGGGGGDDDSGGRGKDGDDDLDVEDDDEGDDGDGKDGKGGKDDADAEDDDEDLGEAGKKALQKEREKNKELRRKLREAIKGKDDKGEDAEEKAREAAEARWKTPFVRREATHALREAGLIGKPDRLLRLLDMDSIDVDIDDDGSVEVDGIDEQIRELRKEYPDLFRKRGSASIDAADRDGDRGGRREKRSATQIQADALLGRL